MLKHTAFRRLAYASLLLAITLVAGVIGFQYLEGYSLLDAFYMTFITMSTVGYGVLGDGTLTDGGKIFVILLTTFTIGAFFYTITTLTTFVVEGEIQSMLKGYRVNKEIGKLKDHIIICGLGRNGHQAAKELMAENVPFVVIEHDHDVVDHFLEQNPEALVLRGDATSEDLLREANISTARGVISALADDASNVYVTLTIRQLNPNVQVVARASNESTISKLKVAGASRVILPNMLGGRKMAKIITMPALMDFVDLITGQGQFKMTLEQVDCDPGSTFIGKTLREMDIRSKTGVLVLGTQDHKGNFELNPDVNRKLVVGERLFVLGSQEQVDKFHQIFT